MSAADEAAVPVVDEVFAELADAPRWLGWEFRFKGRLARKVPKDARTGRDASVADPATWSSLAAARRMKGTAGIGLVLTGDGVGGVDLDCCRDAETGEIEPWARRVVAAFNSYTEVSPSGTGLKIYALGAPAKLRGNKISKGEAAHPGAKAPAIEAYTTGRYFAVTGQHLDGTPLELVDATEAWERLDHQLGEARPAVNGHDRGTDEPAPPELAEFLNDPGILKIWRGVKDDGDRSASGRDAALATLLWRAGAPEPVIRAAFLAYPHGQVAAGKLTGAGIERRLVRLLELARVRDKPAEEGGQPPCRADVLSLPLTPAAWAARELPPPDRLMGDLLSTTSRTLLAADTGLGKSMFGLGMAAAMNLGRGFLHWRCHRAARVLVLDGEMPPDLLQERIALACAWNGVAPPDITDGLFVLSREDASDMPPLDTPDGAEWLLATADALKIDFVVLDNVMSLTLGDLREGSTWQALLATALRLTSRKVGQLWLHHVGNDKGRGYGSGLFGWQMDNVGVGEAVVADGDADVSFKLSWTKARRRTRDTRAEFAPHAVRLADKAWTSEPAEPGCIKGAVKVNPAGQVALDALRRALDDTGARPVFQEPQLQGVNRAVAVRNWRAYFGQTGGYEGTPTGKDAERKAFTRGKENLLAAGMVKIWSEWAWLP